MAKLLMLLSLLLAGAASALAQEVKAPQAPQIFALEDVRVGQKGEGFSVFGADGMRRFEVEILGVMPDFIGPDQDLILVRLAGADIEHNGVVSGMSGSPVYIDGKLLGAVAYRLGAFPKDPIAGVTPAALMLAASRPAPATNLKQQAMTTAYGPVLAIDTPLLVGGAAPGVLARFAPQLQALGLAPTRAGSAGRVQGSAQQAFVPGGAMGAVLVDGDMSIAALGTVTHVDGKRVIGFGHPFLGRGQSAIPLATAEVLATLPSFAGSSKLGNMLEVVGTIDQDRSVGVAGLIGALPRMLQVDLDISGPEHLLKRDRKQNYRFRVVEDPTLTPLLCELTLASALGERVGFDVGGTVAIDALIKTEELGSVRIRGRYAAVAGESPAGSAANAIASALGTLWRNPFRRLKGVQVKVHAAMEQEPSFVDVYAVRIVSGASRVGQPVSILVDTQSYRGKPESIPFSFQLPVWASAGQYKLTVGSADKLAALDKSTGRTHTPYSLQDIVRALNQARRTDLLYVVVSQSDKGLEHRGVAMPALPPSMQGMLAQNIDEQSRRSLNAMIVFDAAIDTHAQVRKSAELTFDVMPQEPQQ